VELSNSVPAPLAGARWSVPAPGTLAALVSQARALQPYLVETRRSCHQMPELGWLEFNTTNYIAKALAEMGYRPECGASFLAGATRLGLASIIASELPTSVLPGDTGCISITP
jgi:metal-dependent amidase/aminoacylase/carboxypeptidase family protein